MPHSQIIKAADTGDILLFSGDRIGCLIQRFITRSRFGNFLRRVLDHVGILLRYQNGKLFLLEATSTEGVEISEWNTASNYSKIYEQIVYRKLFFKRTSQTVTKLEQFLKSVRGRKYDLDPLKLFKKYSSIDSVRNIKKDKGYFCSELVASAYKVLEILPEHICSSQYWPGSFSAEESLQLRNGAHFGNECLIDFSS